MISAAILLFLSLTAAGQNDSLLVMFWNLENFFDYTDDGSGESDREFSSSGSRRWTARKFYAKCDAVAKSFMWIGDRYGRMPDVVGVAEVENRKVLTRMLNSTLLRKCDYSVVHFDSPDRRGIDVALIYRKSVLSFVSASRRVPVHEGEPLATRDILHVCLQDHTGQNINLIVNHHPSKFGGEARSKGRRESAMRVLKGLCDSLASGTGRILAMGDFNDTPDGSQFSMLDGLMTNMGIPLHEDGQGSIRHEGRWQLIDFFLASPDLRVSPMEVVRIPFLMTYDRKHPGDKPLRTYLGPRYQGGVSDHCPIILKLY